MPVFILCIEAATINMGVNEFTIRDFFKWVALCNANVDCFHMLIVFLTLSITATYLHVMKFYTLKHLATSIGLQVVNLKLSTL